MKHKINVAFVMGLVAVLASCDFSKSPGKSGQHDADSLKADTAQVVPPDSLASKNQGQDSVPEK